MGNVSRMQKTSLLIVIILTILFDLFYILHYSCTTSKSFRIFAKNHQNLKMKEILTLEQNRAGAKFEGPFGIKTSLYVTAVIIYH
jgi:hypothetical protein